MNLKSGDVRRSAAPPVVSFHHVNAYEEDDGKGGLQIVMDVCTIDPNNIGKIHIKTNLMPFLTIPSHIMFFVKSLFAALSYKNSNLLLINYLY